MKEKSNEIKSKKIQIKDAALIGLMTALIAACAWISIPLTVPITLQTMGVCLAAGLLGAKRGTISVAAYIVLGLVGVPVFSGFKGGAGVLFGTTGGYIIGFIFTALIVGAAADKFGKKLWVLAVSMVAGVLVCYAFGTVWFLVLYNRTSETAAGLATVLGWCVTPFLIPDAVKIAVAAVLTNRLKSFIK